MRLRVFAGLSALGLAGIGLLIAAASSAPARARRAANYRLARLPTFLNPPTDVHGDACYQARAGAATRSTTAAGSASGWARAGSSGTGCPTADNDFIFAVIAEELGVVGCVVVLALFGVLAYTGLRIARRVDDPFRRLAAAARHHLAGRARR